MNLTSFLTLDATAEKMFVDARSVELIITRSFLSQPITEQLSFENLSNIFRTGNDVEQQHKEGSSIDQTIGLRNFRY